MLLRLLGVLPLGAMCSETWHLVDVAQVVCPKPTSSSLADSVGTKCAVITRCRLLCLLSCGVTVRGPCDIAPVGYLGNPDAPAFPDYNLGIEYTSAMDVSAPHIVTFVRSSQQAVTISFKIEDSGFAELCRSG